MPKITLVLHNIRSTHNVGSIFRTADGLGVANIICSGYTPYPKIPNDKRLPHIAEKTTSQIKKTALGAENTIPFEHVVDIKSWISTADLPIVGLEQTQNSIPLPSFTPPQSFALILGEEVNGIAPDILATCETIVEIPMFGKKESFNVSVACGIALYGMLFNNNTVTRQ